MKGSHLGEFQELVLLTIMVLKEGAYGVSIKREIKARADRSISRGALHTALSRLEEKGLIESWQGEANKERGGMRKRYYKVTDTGATALRAAKQLRDSLWNEIPDLSLQPQHNYV